MKYYMIEETIINTIDFNEFKTKCMFSSITFIYGNGRAVTAHSGLAFTDYMGRIYTTG